MSSVAEILASITATNSHREPEAELYWKKMKCSPDRGRVVDESRDGPSRHTEPFRRPSATGSLFNKIFPGIGGGSLEDRLRDRVDVPARVR